MIKYKLTIKPQTKQFKTILKTHDLPHLAQIISRIADLYLFHK